MEQRFDLEYAQDVALMCDNAQAMQHAFDSLKIKVFSHGVF